MKVIAMIPARYEASRFPGKLMKTLGGKSLIRYTYDTVVHTGLFSEVYVVTDSDIIYDEIAAHGGQVIKSKMEHQSGSDRIAEAVADMDVDIVINVQGDEPFIDKKPLKDLISVFKEDAAENIDIASLMTPISDIDEIQNPNNVKVVCDNEQCALYFSRSPIPYSRDGNNIICFKHIGIYAFRKLALMTFTKLEMSTLEKIEKLENLRFLSHGMKVKMVETDKVAIGIDTPEDYEKAMNYLKNDGK